MMIPMVVDLLLKILRLARIFIRVLLTSVSRALVKDIQYSKIILEFVQSIFVKYKKIVIFNAKITIFVSSTSVWDIS
jgi:hypothetical protein